MSHRQRYCAAARREDGGVRAMRGARTARRVRVRGDQAAEDVARLALAPEAVAPGNLSRGERRSSALDPCTRSSWRRRY